MEFSFQRWIHQGPLIWPSYKSVDAPSPALVEFVHAILSKFHA